MDDGDSEYDLFMSYSHEDSQEVVDLLVGELEAFGLDVWHDQGEVKLGDSIRASIDEGQTKSKYGVVVLSESYFEGTSEWELNGLVNMHTEEENVILPLWHDIGYEDVYEQSPSLADIRAEPVSEDDVRPVAAEIYRVVQEEKDDAEDWGEESDQSTDESGTTYVDLDVRFQESFDPEISKEVTILSWRNHGSPDISQIEATEIRDEDRGLEYTSSSKGTMMSVARIDDEPLNGTISDIQTLSSKKTEFTMRLEKDRLDSLPDDRDFYKSGFVR